MQNDNAKLKILVFLHGTTIMHGGAVRHSREERVEQSKKGGGLVLDFGSYIPIGNAVRKLQNWERQSAIILYMSSHENEADVRKDVTVLRQYNFPRGQVFFRRQGKQYKDVVERIKPDILIEDDCESIGGEKEMVYPSLKPKTRKGVRSIIVKEFEGIDHIPDDLQDLVENDDA